jgi:hypothetical protein
MKWLEFLEGRRWRFDEEDRKTMGAFWVFSALFFVVPAVVLTAARRVVDFFHCANVLLSCCVTS